MFNLDNNGRIKKLEDLDRACLYIEERVSDNYIGTMVEIHQALHFFSGHLLKNTEIDFHELYSNTGNMILFPIEHNKKYRLKFDIEFVSFLPPELAGQVLDDLTKDQMKLSLRNKRLLIELNSKLNGHHDSVFGGLNVFDEVRKTEASIEERINRAKNFKGSMAELRFLNEGFYLPATTHFELMLVEKILEDEKNPWREDVLFMLKGSYFKGSAGAFTQSLQGLFNSLQQGAELLSERANEIIISKDGKPLPRKQVVAGRNVASYGFNAVDDEEMPYDRDFNKEARLWLELQAKSFNDCQGDWNFKRFETILSRLRSGSGSGDSLNQDAVTSLSDFVFTLIEKIKTSSETRSAIFTSTYIEKKLGICSDDDFPRNQSWIWANRLRLVHLLDQVLHELESARDQKGVTFPKELENALENAANVKEEGSIRARAAMGPELRHLDPLPFEQQLADLVAIAIETPADEYLKSLLELHEQVLNCLNKLNIHDVGWYARLRAGYPEWDDMEKVLQDLQNRCKTFEAIRETITGHLVDAYDDLDSYIELDPETLKTTLEIVKQRRLQMLASLDFERIDNSHFKGKFEAASIESDPEEVLLRLSSILEEIRAIPSDQHLEHVLKPWSKLTPDASLNTHKEFIKEHRPRLDALSDQIREKMRALLEEGASGDFRIRMEAFDLWEHTAEYLTAELDYITHEIPRINAMHAGPVKQFKSLERQILEEQKFFRPKEHNNPKALADLILFKASPDLSETLMVDLNDNLQALIELQERTSKGFRELREEQARFGRKENLKHLQQILNYDDVKTLQKIYGLKFDIGQEDLQRLALSYRERAKLQKDLFEQLMKNKINPDPSFPTEVLSIFKTSYYKKFQKEKSIPAELKLAMLYHFPEFLEAEIHFLYRILSYARPTSILDHMPARNYIDLFGFIHRPNPQYRLWLRRFMGKIRSIRQLNPDGMGDEILTNYSTLMKELERIVGDKLN